MNISLALDRIRTLRGMKWRLTDCGKIRGTLPNGGFECCPVSAMGLAPTDGWVEVARRDGGASWLNGGAYVIVLAADAKNVDPQIRAALLDACDLKDPGE